MPLARAMSSRAALSSAGSPSSRTASRYAAMSSFVFRVSAASQRRVLRAMSSSLNLLSQLNGTGDVAILASFVTAAQQDHDRFAALDEVDAIAGALVDP